MNQRASNTFLKSLEEPGEKTIFILISNTPPDLLPTIQSRLQIKRFKKMETETLLNHFTKRKPTKQDHNDIKKAIKFHKVISKADIGQSLIVSNGLCIAIETLPGTDAMIEFVLNFKNKDKKIRNSSEGILFKSLKVNQDPRFDFPVVGEKTLINLRKAKINGLALFENRLILLNKEKLIKLADELDLFIFVVK